MRSGQRMDSGDSRLAGQNCLLTSTGNATAFMPAMGTVLTADTAIAWDDTWSRSAPVRYPTDPSCFDRANSVRAAFHRHAAAARAQDRPAGSGPRRHHEPASARLAAWAPPLRSFGVRMPSRRWRSLSATCLRSRFDDFERLSRQSSFASALQRMLASEVSMTDAVAVGRAGRTAPRARLEGLLSGSPPAAPSAELGGHALPPLQVQDIRADGWYHARARESASE